MPLTASGAERAGIYVCGITPYDATHLGHAATYIAFDLLIRAWLDAGIDVTYASNVTDVDDPLLERATATGQDWRALAASQIALFAEDMTALGVIPPQVYLGAVETVPQVSAVVHDLVIRGLAYRVPLPPGAGGDRPDLGDVYADLGSDRDFGLVSHLTAGTMTDLFAARGGDPDRPGKRHPLDPLLWRRERPGEPAWDGGELGTGRPGWHIECAVIARAGLGAAFDVQGGGHDLLFPHHEMSTAHSRVIDDADGIGHGPGARHHVHAGLVGYHGAKMSKSLGNLVLVSNLRMQGADPAAIRLAVLAHHYRQDWEWHDADLDDAEDRLDRWRMAVSGYGGADPADVLDELRRALADDLDAPRALRAVDAWAERTLSAAAEGAAQVEGAAGVVSRAVNALLGLRL